MTMDFCLKEYAEELLVCVDAPASHNRNRTLYSRLRFGLLASSWLPSPLGIFVWSALHVMLLIVGGPAFWVLSLLIVFFINVFYMFGTFVICLGLFYVMYVLIALAVDLVHLLHQSIRFCWSLVSFLVCHEPIVEWRRSTCWTISGYKDVKDKMGEMFWGFVPIGVPCMSGSWYEETKDSRLKTWARWGEEVVHMHEAIAL